MPLYARRILNSPELQVFNFFPHHSEILSRNNWRAGEEGHRPQQAFFATLFEHTRAAPLLVSSRN